MTPTLPSQVKSAQAVQTFLADPFGLQFELAFIPDTQGIGRLSWSWRRTLEQNEFESNQHYKHHGTKQDKKSA